MNLNIQWQYEEEVIEHEVTLIPFDNQIVSNLPKEKLTKLLQIVQMGDVSSLYTGINDLKEQYPAAEVFFKTLDHKLDNFDFKGIETLLSKILDN